MNAPGALAHAFATHRRLLFGIAYRMLGSARDADDVVQETFVRVLKSPPDVGGELRPLLVTIAMNVARDLLRRRRAEGYPGAWLPAPFEAETEAELELEPSVEARYSLVESASIAFLLALEALSPTARAVTLLRDVFDYSVAETAAALGIGEGNVKTTHHRARATLARYDATRAPLDEAHVARSRVALEAFLVALAAGDVPAIEALLAKDVVAVADAAGEFHSAKTMVGAARVALVYAGIARKSPPPIRFTLRTLNGLPTLVAERDPRDLTTGVAPRFTLSCDVDASGKIVRIHTILATAKLQGLAPVEATS
jgi:RNA polymerase sigma-70 factor, ECF subfamily